MLFFSQQLTIKANLIQPTMEKTKCELELVEEVNERSRDAHLHMIDDEISQLEKRKGKPDIANDLFYIGKLHAFFFKLM